MGVAALLCRNKGKAEDGINKQIVMSNTVSKIVSKK
jgi:hypothetical protein